MIGKAAAMARLVQTTGRGSGGWGRSATAGEVERVAGVAVVGSMTVGEMLSCL